MLPAYRSVLVEKYGRGAVYVRRHGIFSARPEYPDLTLRGNPEHRILAFGKWGTYKRLEPILEAFDTVLQQVPEARLIIAGTDHPKTPGYLQSVQDKLSYRGALEQLWNVLFRDVSCEPDLAPGAEFILHGLQISRRFGVVGACDNEPRLRNLLQNRVKGFENGLQPFVSAPFSKCEDAMFRVPTQRQIRIFRPRGKNAMPSHIDRTASIFFHQHTPVGRQHDRDRIREQHDLCGHESSRPVQQRKAHPSVFQVDSFHELVQGDVGIRSHQPGEPGNCNPHKRSQRLAAETPATEIEPDHLRALTPDRT